jgi:hypothetical protein
VVQHNIDRGDADLKERCGHFDMSGAFARPSVLSLTQDSQIGANQRICADAEDRADFDQRS